MQRFRISLIPLQEAFPLLILIAMVAIYTPVYALSSGEIVALKDMQAEWGNQLGWTGSPSCNWSWITCDSNGNVVKLYFIFIFLRINLKTYSFSLSSIYVLLGFMDTNRIN